MKFTSKNRCTWFDNSSDKDSGEIHSLGTAKPLEEYLQDYEIKKATFGLP